MRRDLLSPHPLWMASVPSVLQLPVCYFESTRLYHLCYNLIWCDFYLSHFAMFLNQRAAHLLGIYKVIMVHIYCQYSFCLYLYYRDKQVSSTATSHF